MGNNIKLTLGIDVKPENVLDIVLQRGRNALKELRNELSTLAQKGTSLTAAEIERVGQLRKARLRVASVARTGNSEEQRNAQLSATRGAELTQGNINSVTRLFKKRQRNHAKQLGFILSEKKAHGEAFKFLIKKQDEAVANAARIAKADGKLTATQIGTAKAASRQRSSAPVQSGFGKFSRGASGAVNRQFKKSFDARKRLAEETDKLSAKEIKLAKVQKKLGASSAKLTKAEKKQSSATNKLSKNDEQAIGSLTELSRVVAVMQGPLGPIAGRLTAMVSAIRNMGSSALVTGLAMAGLVKLYKAAIPAAIELQRAQTVLSAATANGAKAFKFVLSESRRIGASFVELSRSYAQLSAASRGTVLEGAATKKIFGAINTASLALRLSVDQTKGALKAIEQMISKGTVSSEELRQQLGERLPGAFRLAADSMGMTTASFNKALASGKILAEELIPKLGDAIQNAFSAGAEKSIDTLGVAIERLGNESEVALGKLVSKGILRDLKAPVDGLTKLIKVLEPFAGIISGIIATLAGGFLLKNAGKIVKFFGNIATGLAGIAGGVAKSGAAIKTATKATATALTTNAAITGRAVAKLGGKVALARTAVSLFFEASALPGIGTIIGAIGAVQLAFLAFDNFMDDRRRKELDKITGHLDEVLALQIKAAEDQIAVIKASIKEVENAPLQKKGAFFSNVLLPFGLGGFTKRVKEFKTAALNKQLEPLIALVTKLSARLVEVDKAFSKTRNTMLTFTRVKAQQKIKDFFEGFINKKGLTKSERLLAEFRKKREDTIKRLNIFQKKSLNTSLGELDRRRANKAVKQLLKDVILGGKAIAIQQDIVDKETAVRVKGQRDILRQLELQQKAFGIKQGSLAELQLKQRIRREKLASDRSLKLLAPRKPGETAAGINAIFDAKKKLQTSQDNRETALFKNGLVARGLALKNFGKESLAKEKIIGIERGSLLLLQKQQELENVKAADALALAIQKDFNGKHTAELNKRFNIEKSLREKQQKQALLDLKNAEAEKLLAQQDSLKSLQQQIIIAGDKAGTLKSFLDKQELERIRQANARIEAETALHNQTKDPIQIAALKAKLDAMDVLLEEHQKFARDNFSPQFVKDISAAFGELFTSIAGGAKDSANSMQILRKTLKSLIIQLLIIKPLQDNLNKLGGIVAAAFSVGSSIGSSVGNDAVSAAHGLSTDLSIPVSKFFATGGSFTIPGSGGTDSQVVRFRGTPGERVTVQTPGQQSASGSGMVVQQTFQIDARGATPGMEEALKIAVAQGAQRGYEMVAQDFRRNGPIRQSG